jgi:hypothetical protein
MEAAVATSFNVSFVFFSADLNACENKKAVFTYDCPHFIGERTGGRGV